MKSGAMLILFVAAILAALWYKQVSIEADVDKGHMTIIAAPYTTPAELLKKGMTYDKEGRPDAEGQVLYRRLTEICGSSGDGVSDVMREAICVKRDILHDLLTTQGFCYDRIWSLDCIERENAERRGY